MSLWYLVIAMTRISDSILPAPHQVAFEFLDKYALLVRHTLITLQEVALGLLVGVPLGVASAVVLVWSPALERAIMPWVVFLQNVPKIVVAPLFVIWFGFGIGTKIVIVCMLVIFPILVTTIVGLKSVEPDMLDLIRTMGASKWQVFYKARLPGALPSFFSGLKLSATFAAIGAIVGEWMGADAGLGYYLLVAQHNVQTKALFASIVLVAVIGLLLYQLAVVSERVLLRWHVSVREEETRRVRA